MARTLLKKGLVWQVGNGSNITFGTTNPNNPEVFKVNDLIDFELGYWKVSLI